MAPAKNPWWQTAKTPKWGFILGSGWLLYAATWTVDLILKPRVVSAVQAVIGTMLASTYLVSAALLRRRQRSAEDSTLRHSGPSTGQ
jgi:hypothetical protein